eukprot:693337-Prorocentrum_minimum.AAC.1
MIDGAEMRVLNQQAPYHGMWVFGRGLLRTMRTICVKGELSKGGYAEELRMYRERERTEVTPSFAAFLPLNLPASQASSWRSYLLAGVSPIGPSRCPSVLERIRGKIADREKIVSRWNSMAELGESIGRST